VEYPTGHPILTFEGRRLLIAAASLDLSRALSPNLEAVVGTADTTESKAEQDARASTLRMLGFTAVPAAAAAILDSTHAGKRARQLGRRRSVLAETVLIQARNAAQQDLQKRGSEVLNRALLAVARGVNHRLFAIQADIDALIAAARAELTRAEKLDQKLVFNQAAVRGAALAMQLTEAAGDARRAWVAEAAAAIKRHAALSRARYFWVVPRKVSQEHPAGQQ
jgi:ATP-dependent helicase HepA